MDGMSQETIHMHNNLIYTMATISGRKLLIWKLSKSKNIKYSEMSEMHTSKLSQGRNFTLWVGLNLKNYKDMFLSCTKHFMVQDQEEHVGKINSFDILHHMGFKTSEVNWGGHDPTPNHVNESLLSEVDWGAHNPDADDPEQLTGK